MLLDRGRQIRYTAGMAIESFEGAAPQVAGAAFIAASADIIGQVQVAEDASVWYNTTIRGDVAAISIGKGSNVQDNCCMHVHACTVEDKCLIGMGAIVLDGAVVGRGSIVGAHALVTKNTIIPPHSLVLGSPAKVVKQLPPDTAEANYRHALGYVELARRFAAR